MSSIQSVPHLLATHLLKRQCHVDLQALPATSRVSKSCWKTRRHLTSTNLWRVFLAVSRVEGVHVDFMPRFCIGGDLGLAHVL